MFRAGPRPARSAHRAGRNRSRQPARYEDCKARPHRANAQEGDEPDVRSVAERPRHDEEEPSAVLPSSTAEGQAAAPDSPPAPVVIRTPVDVRSIALTVLAVLGATLM